MRDLFDWMSNVTLVAIAASVAVAVVGLSPPQPEPRRALKLVLWTLATPGDHYVGLALWVF
jgi:negative regulator of sigma E activity